MAKEADFDLDSLIKAVVASDENEAKPLTGDDLLACVKENSEAPKDVLLEKAGYVTTKNGKKVTNPSGFYLALIEAQGLSLPNMQKAKPQRTGGVGRTLPYKTKVMKNGSLVVGAGYFRAHGYSVGDTFKIKITDGSIRIDPCEPKDD